MPCSIKRLGGERWVRQIRVSRRPYSQREARKEIEVKEEVITEVLKKDGGGHKREVVLLGAFIAIRRDISRGITQSKMYKISLQRQ